MKLLTPFWRTAWEESWVENAVAFRARRLRAGAGHGELANGAVACIGRNQSSSAPFYRQAIAGQSFRPERRRLNQQFFEGEEQTVYVNWNLMRAAKKRLERQFPVRRIQ